MFSVENNFILHFNYFLKFSQICLKKMNIILEISKLFALKFKKYLGKEEFQKQIT